MTISEDEAIKQEEIADIPIKEINYGFAFVVTDDYGNKTLEIHKHLKEFPSLYKKVISHEIEHLESKNNNLDFWIDFKSAFDIPFLIERTKFCFKYPRALMAELPVFYENGRWIPNWFLIIVYSILIVLLITESILLI